ncbi:SIR2 family protein [Tenuifilum sp.]|uniref:SIR2 family protein n=1 Tax=Tenuifilum sp. TaxID=2760880 RepID=UPI002CF8D227|nr:SIR2 family protein [Tenuifilum sp.]
MQTIDKDTFLRGFKVLSNQSFDLFLGAGASISSGIHSGSDLVWHFKRELLSVSGKINGKKFQDLKVEANKKVIQSYFAEEDAKVTNHYSYYFEKCYPDPLVRQEFLTNLIKDKKPSIGFMCLSALVSKQKINTVWTTNFDDLIEKAISKLDISCQVVSPENAKSVQNYRNDIPTVVKLHGDFRYDALQNTDAELQHLEENLHNYFLQAATQRGLLVVGYSGGDESVLQTLEKALEKPNAFPKGLIWCIPKDIMPSERLSKLIDKAYAQNQRSGFMVIDSFDYFLHELYTVCELKNEQIDSIANERFEQRRFFRLTQNQANTTPVLLNAIKATHFPKTIFSTKTKINGEGKWKKLREVLKDSNIVAAFSKGETLSLFGNENEIKDVFKDYLTDDLKPIDIQEHLFHQPDSFYIGMLYELIEKSLVNDFGLALFSRGRNIRKVFSVNHPLNQEEIKSIPSWLNLNIPKGYQVFEAFEFKVEFVNKDLFLLICPTIHIQTTTGEEPDRLTVQNITNIITSNRWNKKYGEKVNFWFKELKRRKPDLTFRLGDFKIKLSDYYATAAQKMGNFFCFDSYAKIKEPLIYFHHQDESKQSIHPINGLKILGPLEESFGTNGIASKIQLAIIAPDTGFEKVKTHLESLLNLVSPTTEKEYLKDYPGFDAVFKKHLVIPNSIQNEFVVAINSVEIRNYSAIQFYELIKSKIDKLALKNSEIDCVVIYIPNAWKNFRELKNEQTYFDLHDSLKLYAVKKGLRLQFIEDKSIGYGDQAKVKWWLSLGIYVKSNGTPWKVKTDNTETAFVGLGYAIRQNARNKVVLGSSQIFDGSGNGLRFLLQPIEKPVFYNKNPFMSKDDAFRLVTNIRNTYHKIDPVIGLKKLVLHKTTHFTRDEMDGICNALEGIDNIELLQIQQFSNWRAIKLRKKKDGSGHEFDGFPIDRGTIIQLDEFSFLLWTHGLVQSNELAKPYYQGKRGIPTPLLIKRFRGTDPIETVANDILKLTKMNWNGAELYKTMPVTIDFSKRLSVMGKQLEELGNKAYDFRYFI